MTENKKIKSVLIVCMGNICRSPTMESVLKYKAQHAGITLEIESAGTISYHKGNPPDNRSRAHGERRGYDFSHMHARQIQDNDFAYFDLILCADKQNLADLTSRCPKVHLHKLGLFLQFGDMGYSEIPDPYYGGDQGFENVLDLVENASEHLIKKLLDHTC
ncbi:Low molecular weight protein tyrosine phosphatase [Pseudoalteromonas luteoviolacea B = ATCC 29581]|nr:Low molecular weight protein tyrosine phosphatase [Pseudoalteromonas luteoviolacea B = ATCC 29581]